MHADAARAAEAIRQFGFDDPKLSATLLLEPGKIIRMGNPPFRLEVLTTISGVEFVQCYAQHSISEIDGLEVPFIGLDDLKANKRASARLKDLADVEHLS